MKNLNCGIWKVSRLFLIEKIRCAYSKTFRQCERIFGEGTVSSEKSSPSHTRLHSLCFKGNCWQFLCCVFLDNFYVHKRIYICIHRWASLVSQMVKNPPAMQETWVWSLSWKHPLEKGMATHSSILVWRILWTEEPGRPQSTGSQRVRQDWATNTHTRVCVCVCVYIYMCVYIYIYIYTHHT